MLAEADEGQVLASYRAGVLEPWLDLASQELLHKSIMCLYNSIKSCCAPSSSGCEVHISSVVTAFPSDLLVAN